MKILFKIILEFIYYIYVGVLLNFPGALIRWLFLCKKHDFTDLLDYRVYWNILITLLLFGLIISWRYYN